MNELKKSRIKTVFKYSWPFYLISAVLTVFGLYFVFSIIHKTPAYKTLTLFASGEVTEPKKLNKDLLERYKGKELKSFSCISANPNDGNYYSKLSVPGYNSSDVLIIPTSVIDNLKLNLSAFALDLSEDLVNSYYQGYTLYQQNTVNYGVKIDREKVKEYMALPNEDCYLFLNGKSVNIGEYSTKPNKAHDTALCLVKDWGM